MDTLILIILILVAYYFINKLFLSKFKFPKVGSIAVFTGGVKVGKSAVSLACAISNYKRARRLWRIKNFIIKIINKFRKNKLDFFEEPYFYSTIPLRYIKYIQLTREHLLRQKRIRRGSVVFIDEASLVADSQLIQDKKVNSQLLLFFKLFGHECGGLCVVNTHCLTDLHYALKRCTSQYFYIHHLTKYIPFLTLAYMREERYSEDGTTMNNYNEDLEDSLKRCLMLKSTFKKYDSFCYSYLTDHLPVDTAVCLKYNGKYDSLKAEEIVSFRREFYELQKRSELENEKENS